MRLEQALDGFIAAMRERDDEDDAQILNILKRMENAMTAMDDKLTELKTKIAAEADAVAKATALIGGFGAQLDAAVAAAKTAGATDAQLQELTDLSDAMDKQTNELSASMTPTATTPPVPPVGPNPPGTTVPQPGPTPGTIPVANPVPPTA